jgi:hypothetical protein
MEVRGHVRRPLPILLIVLPVLALLALGGLANAFWTEGSGGTGSASTGGTQPVTLAPAAPVAGLFPGGTADVTVTVSNPNGASVVITSLVLDTAHAGGGFAVDAAHAACGTASLSYATQTNGGAGWTVPAATGGSDGTLSIRLRGAVTMALDAPNACQGASITVYLAAG